MPPSRRDDTGGVGSEPTRGEQVKLPVDEPTFSPRDGTPGCTTEPVQFGAELPSFDEAGVDVYGVSTDSVDSRGLEHGRESSSTRSQSPTGGLERLSVSLGDRSVRPDSTFVVPDESGTHGRRVGTPDGHACEVFDNLLSTGVAGTQ